MLARFSRFLFSRSQTKILLIEDIPPIGFEGEAVFVKPGHAFNDLIRRRKAVHHFPGIKQRLYPNFSQDLVDSKRQNYEKLEDFKNKMQKFSIDIIQQPSFANPTMTKEVIKKQDILKQILKNFDLPNLKQEQIKMELEISSFGSYQVSVQQYYHRELQQYFDFSIKINIMKPAIKLN